MRFRLFHKLLLTLLVASLASMVLFAVVIHWYVGFSFVRYLNEERTERLTQLAGQLAEFHRTHGSFEALDHRAWRELLREARMLRGGPPRHPHRHGPPMGVFEPAPGAGGPAAAGPVGLAGAAAGFGPPPPPPEEAPTMAGGPRAPLPPAAPLRHHRVPALHPTLYDPAHRVIMGPLPWRDGLSTVAVRVDGRLVGWLGIPPIERPSAPREIRFLRHQAQAFAITAVLVCVLAALLAVLLARRLARPILAISATTRELAEGRYEARVAAPGGDEIGALARDVNQLARTLEDNERSRRRWIADISHELRTPLAILRGEVEAVRDGIRRCDQAFVDSLLDESERLARLVEDLYQLARADIGALDYRFASLDFAAVVDEALGHFTQRFADAGLLVQSALERPLAVHADRDRLRQLLENLCENCCRYVQRPGTVTVTLRRRDGHAELVVADSGPGVAADELAGLFEPLARAERSRSRDYGGAGLGLALCRRIATAHGGRIDAAASPPGGLAVRLTLPLEQ